MHLTREFIRMRIATEQKPPSQDFAREVGESLKVNWDEVSLEQFTEGLGVEMEHADHVPGILEVGRIVLDHLKENPHYYTILKSEGL